MRSQSSCQSVRKTASELDVLHIHLNSPTMLNPDLFLLQTLLLIQLNNLQDFVNMIFQICLLWLKFHNSVLRDAHFSLQYGEKLKYQLNSRKIKRKIFFYNYQNAGSVILSVFPGNLVKLINAFKSSEIVSNSFLVFF